MFNSRSIKLIIESRIDDTALLAQAVRAVCYTVVQEETLLYKLVLCLVEAVTNVIKHAYHKEQGHFIEVRVTVSDEDVVFEISDDGDKAELPPPKKDLGIDPNDITSLPESGMGLFLIYQIMDEVLLSEKDKKNILLMRKHIGK
jgi:serine/threonine-protein kinase RsbW